MRESRRKVLEFLCFHCYMNRAVEGLRRSFLAFVPQISSETFLETITNMHTLERLVTWDDKLFYRYGWCPPKFKWFTWPNYAHFRDSLPSMG